MKILIVDDNQQCLEDICEALKATGYDIQSTFNPNEAIEMIHKDQFDAVITDLKMPQMTGIDFLKLINNYDASLRVIAITAHKDLKTMLSFSNYHGYDFFAKPIQYSQLISTLKDIETDILNKVDYKSIKLESKILNKMHQQINHVFFPTDLDEKKD